MSTNSLFDTSAGDFAGTTDAQIARHQYKRGELFVQAIKEFVRIGGDVLDYGCGPGRIARLIALEGYNVHGVDPSFGMLTEARSQDLNGLRLRFDRLIDNGETLPVASYDAIVCSSTIEYVRDATALLRRFHRALRPNGLLVISYANRRSLWRKYSELRLPTAPHLQLQHNIWTFGEFAKVMAGAGFTIISKPVFAEAAPFDKRPWLRGLSSWSMIGTLGLVVVRRLN
jgi:SAM-dependent methyltransferase